MTEPSAMAKALMKDPEWEYGEILPMATRKGERTWAIPDYLRSPLQSWVNIMDSMGTGQIQTREGTEEMLPDILNVAPIPGAATAVGSNMVRRGALSDEVRAAPDALRYIYGRAAETLEPMTERLQQRRERRALARSPRVRDVPPSRPRSDGPASPAAPPPRPPQQSMDADGLLSEIEELSKMIAANGDEISSLKYSRNRQRLRQNPNSLQSRLERGPDSYSPPPDRMMPTPPPQGPLAYDPRFSGQRPMSRDQLRRMQMAHGEFRASIDGPQAAFRAGKITEAEFNAAAKRAVTKAARGNNVDPRYLAEQIAKDQRRDPKGWALTFPDTN